MNADALAAHARDELGISEVSTARPIQAALTSAATFSAGAVAPVLAAVASPSNAIAAVAVTSLLCLAMLGYVGARLGGGGAARAVARVVFWGVFAMLATSGEIGRAHV